MYRNSILDDFKNAWNRPNNSLVQIILINVIVFALVNILYVFAQLGGQKELFSLVFNHLQIPADPESFLYQPWSVITYFFTHKGVFHLAGNMLFLYWFGKIIQEYLNSNRVISLYVLGGISGAAAYMLIYNLLPIFAPSVSVSYMHGASAGVFAIVVGAAVLLPNYTMFLMFIGPVKIKYIAMVYVFLSFIGTAGANAGGEIAHLGGAIMGVIFIRQLQKGNDLGAWIIQIIDWTKGIFKPQPTIRVTHRKGNKRPSQQRKKEPASTFKTAEKGRQYSAADVEGKPNQEEIDAILDKISHSGYESLSKAEKQKLFNASKN